MNETRKSENAAGIELLKEYGAAVSSGDFERWMSLWTESGTQMAPDAPKRTSKDEIRATMEPFFDLFDHEMTVEPEEARLTTDWGFVRGEYTHETSSKVNGERSHRTGKFLTIVEKQSDGAWKIACDCFNYNEGVPKLGPEPIDEARAEITAGWLNSDPDAILNHMTGDAMFLGPHEPRVDGAPAVRQWLERFFSEVKMTRVDMEEDREVLISGDLAVERSSYDWGAKVAGADEESRDEGNFIGVWRRQADGTWKEWCIIWNSWNPAS